MMKTIFSASQSRYRDSLLLMIRIAIGAFMLVHGLPKLEMLLSQGPVKFPAIMGMGPTLSLALTVFAEVACSILILVGFGTRAAVIPLIVTMVVAVFYVHGSDPFIKKEMGLHYLLAYGILLITGSGRYSADYLVEKKLVAVRR